eukprot:2474756-Prymnesium_polylepis.1
MHTYYCRASRPVLGCPQAAAGAAAPLVSCARGAAEPHLSLRGAAETAESLIYLLLERRCASPRLKALDYARTRRGVPRSAA